MRLVSLNTWCGRTLHPLMRFFRKWKNDTDIFCLQEVSNCDQETVDHRHPDEHVCGPLFAKIGRELDGFEGWFATFDDDPDRMSLAMFVRRGLTVVDARDFLIHTPTQPHETGSRIFSPRKLQHVMVQAGDRKVCIANIHGLWNGGPKTDAPERIAQSERIRAFMVKCHEPLVLCGDFNLLPDTESLRMVERGMRNLVREYGVNSTRTVLYREYSDPNVPKFADYVLASPKVGINEFRVLPDLCSDHAALYVDFRID